MEYAIKIINKHVIMRNKIVDYIKNERNILDKLNDEGIVKLKFTFQDEDSLCKLLSPTLLLQQQCIGPFKILAWDPLPQHSIASVYTTSAS
jgi:hypothetical protein